ncbi:hypothetical protein [Microscilla marina]|uniref:Fibronectin type III domain protein n=1 Tax=Microscilla marina ATCC 23134 TaxID=313606 RepID=A1ZHV7_MICM2|nr:hypothetical protein [Microscilla marina]EAY30114.1 fibronectin type III domain protein [Microscilla marina ATCC 23134]
MFKFNITGLLLGLCILSGCALFEKEFILPRPIAHNADQVTAVSFMAHWKKVVGATSYEIDVAADEDFALFVANYQSKKVNEHQTTVEGLEAGKTYFYRVRANISNQTSIHSNIISVTTSEVEAPIAYPAMEVTANQFKIHWEKLENATTYQVDVAKDKDFQYLLPNYSAHEVPQNDSTLLVEDVTVSQQYFYRVRARQLNSFSAYSNVQSVYTSTLPQPIVLPPSDEELTSFTAHWKAMPEAKSYKIDVATDALFNNILSGYNNLDVEANTQLIIPNLDANTPYFYRVRIVNGKEISNHSEVMSAKTSNLDAPVATTAGSIESGGFSAHWNKVPNAASYLLDVALDPSFTQTIAGYNARPVIDNFADVQDLNANTTYFYRVRAIGLSATSDYSNVIKVTTGLLPAPVAKAASNQKAFEFTTQWQALAGISVFLLDVSTDPGFGNFLAGYNGKEVVGTSHKVEGLDFSQTYYYRLRSKRLGKVSDYSNTIAVASCISNTCKVDKIENFASGGVYNEQEYTYDIQGNLTKIVEPSSFFAPYQYDIAYNADNSVQKVTSSSSGTVTQEFIYTYQAGVLSAIRKNDASGNFIEWWVFEYNAKGQRTSWKIYADLAKTSLINQFAYVYNAQGNVTAVTNGAGTTLREYAYDDKLSPYAIFNADLCFYIVTHRDRWVSGVYRGFLPVNNIKSETIGTAKEVFIFKYNNKDVALEQEGYLAAKYHLIGCSF